MKNTVATASRNILRIKARQFRHLAFRAIQKGFGWGKTIDGHSILIYPHIKDEKTLGDILNRLGWYFPSKGLDSNTKIRFGTSVEFEVTPDYVPDYQAKFEQEHLPISPMSRNKLDECIGSCDQILLWDARKLLSPILWSNLDKINIIDPNYYSTVEPNSWIDAARRNLSSNPSHVDFRKLEQFAKHSKRSFVFGTGPSLDDAWQYEYRKDDLTIVCNSIVRNPQLLEHINPDILVFADPVFHFGPSKYADKFRRDAVETLQHFDAIGVVPHHLAVLISNHFPGLDIVGIETSITNGYNIPSSTDPRVRQTSNIMTLLMLPLAASFTNEIYVLGADGREEGESYFWKHNEGAQYQDELMKTVVECHPSFFRDRVYVDYYQDHVQTLSEQIKHLETEGRQVFNLTHSYIDALRARSVSSIQ